MKKYLLGIIAVVIAVGLSSFTNSLKERKSTKTEVQLYWYHVNPTTSRTSSAYFIHDYKSQVMTAACDDDAGQPICEYGSSSSTVALNTFVGGSPSTNLILKDD
jgi:hypothetical protein